MKKRVVVIDYGRGNLLSLTRALAHVGAEAEIASDPEALASAEFAVLPGVGAFGDGMDALRGRGWIDPIRSFCASGRPFLGICLGMQLLLQESSEFGRHEGLGIVPGTVTRFPDPVPGGARYKIPHTGWNRLIASSPRASWKGTVLEGMTPESYVYFVHSFVAEPVNPRHRLADAEYAGRTFCAAVADGNVVGFQFHPEKSGETGLSMLRNWLDATADIAETRS